MLRRILFVDDEPNVLSGLRRMLHGMRREWDMRFAASGAEALTLLASEPFDVVVSDMRMPVMDGAALLHEVMDRHPGVARIVLSGHSDLDLVVRSVLPAHQYISKPCTQEKLCEIIARALSVQELLSGSDIREMVSRIESLPSLPESCRLLNEELASPEPSLARVGAIISRDIAMSAKVLKLVNSSFFGFAAHIASPEQAVTMLGLRIMRALVLSVHIFTEFDSAALRDVSISRLWEHSMRVSMVCRKIASAMGLDQVGQDQCFIAGLLHDVGKLVLAATLPERYAGVIACVRRENRLVREVEFETLGTTHAEVGAYLMGLWGLPDPVIEAVAFHHAPMHAEGGMRPVGAVHIANWLDRECHVINSEYARESLDMEFVERLGCTDRLEQWAGFVEAAEEGTGDER
ncbi:putative nucleotidyltransferase with HDIG domain [Desulfobaculum xiamenense]|uniref:Putative nucleotidyltransferase with HDIG domain n=1 Tax=Desulfobaculum xiamenense TaxID=995050 RepID=A0A846QRJ5_9BACT|nr:response regulator [Desulfobaculum xiamenense]NJB67814.1 putative nucleotidyltransferase with HDIG domain [Desulfobaculum xiamenense]